MWTRFGHEQIARDLRALRRLEAIECGDVEARLLRRGQVAADAGGGPRRPVPRPGGRPSGPRTLWTLLLRRRRVPRGLGS
jgi:hypothetical protein